MDIAATRAQIPESLFEHKLAYPTPWVERWMTIPNPFLSSLLPPLQTVGVELADVSFNTAAANLGDIVLNIAIRKWDAAVRITLNSVTFVAANPNWEQVPSLLAVFAQVSEVVQDVVGTAPLSQQSTLLFHVTPGSENFSLRTLGLVRMEVMGEASFFGVTRYRSDGTLTIDKSLRYEGAAFVRVQSTFPGDAPFTDVAHKIYQDEIEALGLLGLSGLP